MLLWPGFELSTSHALHLVGCNAPYAKVTQLVNAQDGMWRQELAFPSLLSTEGLAKCPPSRESLQKRWWFAWIWKMKISLPTYEQEDSDPHPAHPLTHKATPQASLIYLKGTRSRLPSASQQLLPLTLLLGPGHVRLGSSIFPGHLLSLVQSIVQIQDPWGSLVAQW